MATKQGGIEGKQANAEKKKNRKVLLLLNEGDKHSVRHLIYWCYSVLTVSLHLMAEEIEEKQE